MVGEVFITKSYTLSQAKAKALSDGDTIVTDHKEVPKKKWNHLPMFVPTDTRGRALAHVETRQGFLNEGIARWRRWHLYRAAAVFFFVLSIVAIGFDVLIAAVLAVVAGVAAGRYVWDDYYISYQYRQRKLLEST
ncbi:MAG: hypothetical protein ACE5DI_02855 [Candidatus Micrarchaeia archaeon]